MFKLRIILMLLTIIPSLDCCSSRTLFQRNPIDLYRTMELSMEKTTQYPQEAPPPTSPQLTTTDQSTLSHGHHHRHHSHPTTTDEGHHGESTDEDGENLNLNRSHRSDVQAQEDLLEQQHLHTDHHTQQQRIVANETSTPHLDDNRHKAIAEQKFPDCEGAIRVEFCLNGGRCYLYPIMNHTLWFCVCVGDYIGERCDVKSIEKISAITRPRFVLAKTIGGPLVFGLAFIDILLLLFLFCKNSNRD